MKPAASKLLTKLAAEQTAADPRVMPKGLAEGIAGASLGHVLDGLFSGPRGAGSLIVAMLGRSIAAAIGDTDPVLAASMDGMGTGALASYMAKTGAALVEPPEPLVEEAQKAVAELKAQKRKARRRRRRTTP